MLITEAFSVVRRSVDRRSFRSSSRSERRLSALSVPAGGDASAPASGEHGGSAVPPEMRAQEEPIA
eukprot:468846-Prymnesium_polylepis.1